MRSLLIVGLVFLAGCTFSQTKELGLTPEARLFQVQGEFNILLAAANSYAQRPRCSAVLIVGCSEPRIVDEALHLAERIDAGLRVARAAETPALGFLTVATAELNALLVMALATGAPS